MGPARHRAHALLALLTASATAAAEASDGGSETSHQTVVTASRSEQRAEDAVVATEVVGLRDIERSGARDLGELLETHPGVEVVHSFRGAGLRLLGLDPEYALVLVDGERAVGRTGGTLDLARFSLRGVERVEIVKGPASVLYGADAMAGVVNVVTRQAREPFEAQGRLSYGTRRALDARLESGLRRGPVAFSLSGGLRGADGYDLDRSDVATNGSARSDWDVAASAELGASERLKIRARAEYARTETAAVDATAAGAVFDRRTRDESFGASSRAVWESDATRVTARVHHGLFRSQLLQDQRRSRELDQYQDAREWLWETGVQLDQALGERHRASGAVEGLLESVASPRLVDERASRRRMSGLVQHEAKWLESPRLDSAVGVRVDIDSSFGGHPSPRLALRFDPVEFVTLRFSYGWGFRAPSFTELFLRFENPGVGYVVEGNPLLHPEVSAAAQVWGDVRLGDGASLSFGAFRADVRELISVVTDTSADAMTRFTYANVARARTQGFEVGARARWLSAVWLDLGYALLDARDLEAGELLEGRAVHRGTVAVSVRHRPSGIEANARAGLVGARPFRRGDDWVWAPPYADLDLRVERRMNRHVTVFAVATNVLGAGHAELLPIPPRGIHAGLTARY